MVLPLKSKRTCSINADPVSNRNFDKMRSAMAMSMPVRVPYSQGGKRLPDRDIHRPVSLKVIFREGGSRKWRKSR